MDSDVLPEAVYLPFYQHGREDADANHGRVFFDVFVEFREISEGIRKRIYTNLWHYSYLYRSFYAGIVDFYGNIEEPMYFSAPDSHP